MFDDMHAELFEVFGQDGFVTRGVDPAVPVRVVIDRGVEQFDDLGRVVRRVDVASFNVAEWSPQQNDVLAIGAWSKQVDAIDSDDGFVAKAVMYG